LRCFSLLAFASSSLLLLCILLAVRVGKVEQLRVRLRQELVELGVLFSRKAGSD